MIFAAGASFTAGSASTTGPESSLGAPSSFASRAYALISLRWCCAAVVRTVLGMSSVYLSYQRSSPSDS